MHLICPTCHHEMFVIGVDEKAFDYGAGKLHFADLYECPGCKGQVYKTTLAISDIDLEASKISVTPINTKPYEGQHV